MKEKNRTIISASRRTDIPAFYYDWLQTVLEKGEVTLRNPMFPAKTYHVDLRPENVHSIVLWSKDFSRVAKEPGKLAEYSLYFQYTINLYSKLLEPNVPAFEDSVRTLEQLLKRYDPAQFNIRFDPIIISRTGGETAPMPDCPKKARLAAFERLCRAMKRLGMNTSRITTSYISYYGHVQRKMDQCGIDSVQLNSEEQLKFFGSMVEIADKFGFQIYSCASPLIEQVDGILSGHCIDGELLVSLFGGSVSRQKDKGQRAACGCTVSRDIGAYQDGTGAMKCLHGCMYCYVR